MTEKRAVSDISRAEEVPEYDLVVIGGGPAGYTAALEAAGRGMKTALAEPGELGGTCLNSGCIPTKTLLHQAELYAKIKSAAPSGICAEQVTCDMEALQRHKDEVVGQLRGGIASLLKKKKVDVWQGAAQITDAHEVRLSGRESGDQVLHTERILIATGSVPALPPVPGIDLADVVTSDGLLSREELYPRLTIVGGGVIGMEFASIYSALGCQVTVIEFLDRILANMDREISQNLKMIMKKRGVEIHTGAQLQEICADPAGGLICRYTEKGEEKTVVSDGVLIATGRRPNTEGLFAEGLDIAAERGRILVDEYGMTSVPGIYAAGDVTPGVQLAHAAAAQAVNAVAHMQYVSEQSRTDGSGGEFIPPIRADVIPGCVYTDPEIGCVGLTQEDAKQQGMEVTVKKYPMSANGRTVLSGQERGFIKVVADAQSHRILGAQMMCARATDMIGEFASAVVNGLTLEQMGAVVRPHPTFSEAISEVTRL